MNDLDQLGRQFCDGLAHLLDLPVESVHLEADLRRDLELDSFATITVVCLAEDIAGREMPPGLAATTATVADLWAFCTTCDPADLANRIDLITARFIGILRTDGTP